ncbi:uncharacterized protein LOC121382580 isoform X1 [Gigantopelta aegis]|uniref:uncharacterized protein LOC121382580 isoform X1 n=1 Tax=Gigantopelta aegis TaxID=1735272 RepID=UPI001B88829A|nr:uncharacterized protein LOC121382580 isoform X1 [Gigantopelta aegis]XP_041367997.1 uncharacterized protein LOC121382580 isoform X1 [Gigantopelta aegis]XP_041367998.1 uncharacterized protein LOC121382580 isoform X1 [Gigantopelta aegis]
MVLVDEDIPRQQEMLQPENNSRIVDSLGGLDSPFPLQVSNNKPQRRDDFTAEMLQPENNSRIVNSLGGHNSPFLPQVSNYRSQRRDDFTAEMLQPENNSRIVDSLGGHNSPFLPQVSNYRSQRRDDFTAEHHMVMFYMPPIEEGMNTVEVSTPWPRLIVTGQVISARDMPIVLLLLVFLVVLLVIRQ